MITTAIQCYDGDFRYAEIMVWNETLTTPYLVDRDIDIVPHAYLDSDLIYEVSINDVKPSDAGLYTCRVLIDNHNGSFDSKDQGKSKTLSIAEVSLVLPRCSTNMTIRSDLEVASGTAVILSCTTFGTSELHFQWTRSDDAIISTENPTFDLGDSNYLIAHSSVVLVLDETDNDVIFTCRAMNSSDLRGTCAIGPFKIQSVDNPDITCLAVQVTTAVLLLTSICFNIGLYVAIQRIRHRSPLNEESYVVTEHSNTMNLNTRVEKKNEGNFQKIYDEPAPDLPDYGNMRHSIASNSSRTPLSPPPRSNNTSSHSGTLQSPRSRSSIASNNSETLPPRGGVPIFY